MDVEVDEAGGDDQAAGVDDFGSSALSVERRGRSAIWPSTMRDRRRVAAIGGVDDVAVGDEVVVTMIAGRSSSSSSSLIVR